MADESNIPVTRIAATAAKADSIRNAVRSASTIATENHHSRLAKTDDAQAFHAFLSDPQVHAPIYTLPRPLTVETVRAFVEDHRKQREDGTGLLFLNFDVEDRIGGYIDIQIWPSWAAGELGGAVHPERQGKRRGLRGAEMSFDWMFDVLGLDVICETAAPDNERTAHLLDRLGFRRMGETISYRADGTARPSLIWEVTRPEWKLRSGCA